LGNAAAPVTPFCHSLFFRFLSVRPHPLCGQPGNQLDRDTQRPRDQKAALRQAGLPLTLTVRFVTVRLSTGELEILVTSLLDEVAYPCSDFQQIYHLRWGIETLFAVIKNRLSLENFSGKTAQAVCQDFHATLFLTTLESLLTQDADQQLAQRSRHNRLGQTVNNMVSFHAIKTQVFQLLCSNAPPRLCSTS
jgi:Transposase DDE domain